MEPFEPEVLLTPAFAQASPAMVHVPLMVMLPWARTLPAKFWLFAQTKFPFV
jgi:hypothetical protein